jgi:hypothetical protein
VPYCASEQSDRDARVPTCAYSNAERFRGGPRLPPARARRSRPRFLAPRGSIASDDAAHTSFLNVSARRVTHHGGGLIGDQDDAQAVGRREWTVWNMVPSPPEAGQSPVRVQSCGRWSREAEHCSTFHLSYANVSCAALWTVRVAAATVHVRHWTHSRPNRPVDDGGSETDRAAERSSAFLAQARALTWALTWGRASAAPRGGTPQPAAGTAAAGVRARCSTLLCPPPPRHSRPHLPPVRSSPLPAP